MGRMHKLTATGVAKLSEHGMHSDGAELFLSIGPGRKSWIHRYTLGGRRREMGLGAYPTIGLARARELAAEGRRKVADGVDPIERRVAERAATSKPKQREASFEDCARAYVEAKRPEWRSPKTEAHWSRAIGRAAAAFGQKPVREVGTDDVLRALEPLWLTKPETGSKLREVVEAVLDYAKARGLRDGENVARWKGHLALMLASHAKVHQVTHHLALPYSDAPAFTSELRQRPAPAARALMFTLLTACRSGEALGATWGEVDLDSATWTLPPSRTKQGREHRVALSPQALALLDSLPRMTDSPYLFPGQRRGRPLSTMSMEMLLRRMQWDNRTTVHGLRATFSTWAVNIATYPIELADAALGHAIGNKVSRTYQREDMLDPRRPMMQDWANFCDKPSQPR